MQRILLGIGVGGGVTFCLFVLMAFLIKSDLKPPKLTDDKTIEFVIAAPEDDLKVRNRRLPKPPPPPKSPPPPEPKRVAKVQKPVKNLNINLGKFDVSVNSGTYLGNVGGGNLSDGDAIPMVIIEPRYPRKAAMEGIEGWVRFEFTVSPDGSPKDVKVIDAQPKRIFERDARKAIYKWKFKPRVIDGKAVEQPNMRYTMEFKLGQ
ncbi:energy transducer TonB [Aliikangiella maris]|uniref:Energy transducer TonB n=2 Tax=Aliikangiella maris TaxID=3162458 RepID=A0ABV3MMN5_9GAMM